MSSALLSHIGEYNHDQLVTVTSVLDVLSRLSSEEIESLKKAIAPYLLFRSRVSRHFGSYLADSCRTRCFETGMSLCCGFESIITFFADHVISLLLSSQEESHALVSLLSRPNQTERCVYLGTNGCRWRLPPVSCAMFLCPQLKDVVFDARAEAQKEWSEIQQAEKEFTFPDKPVLFDDLEDFFMQRGCDTPHLFFHRSPGLLRLKSKAGIIRPL